MSLVVLAQLLLSHTWMLEAGDVTGKVPASPLATHTDIGGSPPLPISVCTSDKHWTSICLKLVVCSATVGVDHSTPSISFVVCCTIAFLPLTLETKRMFAVLIKGITQGKPSMS